MPRTGWTYVDGVPHVVCATGESVPCRDVRTILCVSVIPLLWYDIRLMTNTGETHLLEVVSPREEWGLRWHDALCTRRRAIAEATRIAQTTAHILAH